MNFSSIFFVQIRDSVLQKKINEGTLMNQMKKISENIQLCQKDIKLPFMQLMHAMGVGKEQSLAKYQ